MYNFLFRASPVRPFWIHILAQRAFLFIAIALSDLKFLLQLFRLCSLLLCYIQFFVSFIALSGFSDILVQFSAWFNALAGFIFLYSFGLIFGSSPSASQFFIAPSRFSHILVQFSA